MRSSCCFIISPAFAVFNVADFYPSNRSSVVSFCFNLHFHNAISCGTSFHVPVWHQSIFFGLLKSLGHFLIWLLIFLPLDFKGSLRIWDNSASSNVCFCKYFFPNLWPVFLFSWHCHRAEPFSFNEVQLLSDFFCQLVNCFFCGSCFWCYI